MEISRSYCTKAGFQWKWPWACSRCRPYIGRKHLPFAALATRISVARRGRCRRVFIDRLREGSLPVIGDIQLVRRATGLSRGADRNCGTEQKEESLPFHTSTERHVLRLADPLEIS